MTRLDAFSGLPLLRARARMRGHWKNASECVMRQRPPAQPDAGRPVRAACSHHGDSPSRRLLQENGCAGRRSRLKNRAGCRPPRHTLPDPERCRCAMEQKTSRRIPRQLVSKRWKGRLAQKQTGSPYTIVPLLVLVGDPKLEKKLHKRFRASHFRGEWFHSGNAISAYIKENLPNCVAKSAEDDLRMSPLNGW